MLAKFIPTIVYRIIVGTVEYFNRKSPILIHVPLMGTLGNCAEEIHFGLLKARRDGKKIVFLCPRQLPAKIPALNVANRELLNIQSDYCYLRYNSFWRYLGDWTLTAVLATLWSFYLIWRTCLTVLQVLWPKHRTLQGRKWYPEIIVQLPIGGSTLYQRDGNDYFSWDLVHACNWKQEFNEYLPVRLAPEKRRQGEQLRLKMGIPLEDWFVCLHVREAGFYEGEEEREITKYRNASILNYIEGIKVITAAGGWVVRLGDNTMASLPPMERVIDYPHTPFKSELMDIYLISECRFHIGVSSGPHDVARLFGKRELLINLTEWTLAFPMRIGDLAILKHIFSRSRNRFLSLKEILKEPLFECQTFWAGLGDDYIMEENTPEEIRQVTEEFLRKPKEYQYSELQETFNDGRRLQIKRWLEKSLPNSSVARLYRFACHTDSMAGAIGQKYLQQNWDHDTMNENPWPDFTVASPRISSEILHRDVG